MLADFYKRPQEILHLSHTVAQGTSSDPSCSSISAGPAMLALSRCGKRTGPSGHLSQTCSFCPRLGDEACAKFGSGVRLEEMLSIPQGRLFTA